MLYHHFIKPLLFQLDAEKAHNLTIKLASFTSDHVALQHLVSVLYGYDSPSLEQDLWGLRFNNPIGLAAGFDKNGRTPLAIQALGFGFMEIGSVTAKATLGNPKPRAFRLPEDQSLINRMGLNNDGVDAVVSRLKSLELSIPLGINIAKTNNPLIHGEAAIADYKYSYDKVLDVADYITVNISCPNTGEGKTFEDPAALKSLLEALELSKDKPPTLVKFSVDTDKKTLQKLVEICESYGVDGYVATNTSSSRNDLSTPKSELYSIGNGGLSGAAIAKSSTQVVKWLYEVLNGNKPIIGVGGIHDLNTATEKINAGANLIQIYTGLVYEGPGLIKRIKKDLQLL